MSEQKTVRNKMSAATFLFMSIAGAGFILKSVTQQFASLGTWTLVMYLLCIIIYAVPFTMMIVEFSSLKKTLGSESGYQSWMSLVLGRKLGFMAGFFYFFVNLFFFLDVIPNFIIYILFSVGGQAASGWMVDAWFKPMVSAISIVIFWLGTYVSTKGPKWLGKVTSFGGYAGMVMTVIFIIGAFSFLVNGGGLANDNAGIPSIIDENGNAISLLSWDKIASFAWALQTLGGLEAMASYKNDFEGGQKGFKKVMIWNVVIFATVLMITAIMVQLVVPADQVAQWGLVEIIYQVYLSIKFPFWFVNITGVILAIATISSLMFWTAAPVKVLFSDAPTGIFGKWLSKTDKKDGTPVNGLIFQAILVTIFFVILIIAQLGVEGMNTFLIALKNLNGGAATIPILFIVFAYWKMRIKSNKYDRDYYFLGKKKTSAILATIPLGLLFMITTFFALIPSPETFQTETLNAVLMVILGPVGIMGGFIFCGILFKRWQKKNPNDTSVFNITESNESIVKESGSKNKSLRKINLEKDILSTKGSSDRKNE